MSIGTTENGSASQAALSANGGALGDGAANGDAAVTCPSCGAANAQDSRFCRLCGATMRAASRDEALAASPSVASASSRSGSQAGEASVFDHAVTAPDGAASTYGAVPGVSKVVGAVAGGAVASAASEDDARRARQLLDRAFALAERGDTANAILFCRQSVALAPDSPQGFSMLGLLLERTGDLEQAAAAYERVLRLAPDSRLEMESLERIRATLHSHRAQAPASAAPVAAAAAVAPVAVAPVAGASAAPAGAGYAGIPMSAIGHGPIGSMVQGGVATPISGVSIGSAHTTAPAPDDYPNAPSPLIAGTGVGAAPNISALHFDADDSEPEPWWRNALARPSAFSRGLPLAGVAGLSLLFLIWARGAAPSPYPQDTQLPANLDSSSLKTNELPPIPNATSASTSIVAPNASGPSAPAPGVPPGIAGPNDRYPVSNRPDQTAVTAPNSSVPSSNGSAPNASVGAAQNTGGQGSQNRQSVGGQSNSNNSNQGGGRGGSAAGGAGQYPTVSRRPDPVFPSAGRVLPPASPAELAPARSLPAPAPPSDQGAPYRSNNNGLSSGGGGPLGPATSSNRNAITLTPSRVLAAAPPRTANTRAEAESAAARAVTSRRPDTAIANSNQAIRSGGGETGWNYQQRALAFLTRGDNQRAADDFQSAISAYNDQIARGDRVEEARIGVTACRSGLALALQRMGR